MSMDFSIKPVGAPVATPIAPPVSEAVDRAVATELPPSQSVTAVNAGRARARRCQCRECFVVESGGDRSRRRLDRLSGDRFEERALW